MGRYNPDHEYDDCIGFADPGGRSALRAAGKGNPRNKQGDAVSFTGPDAVRCFAAAALASWLGLTAKGYGHSKVGKTQLLKMATSYTGKPYKRGEYLKAQADLKVWVQTMKSALPTRTIGE